MKRLLIAFLLVAASAFAQQRGSQLTCIKITDSADTLIKTYCAPFTLKLSTGLTPTASGSTLTVVAAGGAPSGTAGGGLAGTYPNPTFASAASNNNCVKWVLTGAVYTLGDAGAACGGAGITTLNTLTAATQTFAVGTSGTAPAWVSATSTHTLNIPDGKSVV